MGNDILYLSESEMQQVGLSREKLFDLCRLALAAKGRGQVENPPKPGVHNLPNSFIHAMPAYNAEVPAIGLKWVAGYPDNIGKGLPMISGLLVLNHPETGFPLAIMGAGWLTDARTAAVSAVSAEKLARSDSQVMGIIGGGAQARHHVLALPWVLPKLKTIKLYDRSTEAGEAFIKLMQPQIKPQIELVSSAEEAVRGSDVVITAIPKPKEPIVRYEWLKDGVLCMPLESNRAWQDDALFGVDKFINDDKAQAKLYQQNGAFAGGIPDYWAETGEILCGKIAGRENASEKIMVMNIGLGVVDITIAQTIYELAKQAKIGTWLSI